MTQEHKFDGLTKLPDVTIGPFCAKHRLKINPELELEGTLPLPAALEQLVEKRAMTEYLNVMAHALPPREGVWLACLSVADMHAPDAAPTAALKAAQDWVYKPNKNTRDAVEKAIKAAEMDDPTVLAADAAFHAIVPGLEEEVKSPPAAAPAMVFAAALQSLFRNEKEDAILANWNQLVARSLNIAAGGNGKANG